MGLFLNKLDGYKSYIAIALTCVWSVLYIKHYLPITDENFQLVLMGLITASGLSMRHAVAKGEVPDLDIPALRRPEANDKPATDPKDTK